jgi:hypothetical protein
MISGDPLEQSVDRDADNGGHGTILRSACGDRQCGAYSFGVFPIGSESLGRLRR